jgi:hypothetical protein
MDTKWIRGSFISATFLMSLFLTSVASAQAAPGQGAGSVTVGGLTYTCTNGCVVVISADGRVTIVDCCGGQVRTVIPPAPKEK